MLTDVPICAVCEKPTPDGYVCEACADRLGDVLARLPASMSELEVTIARQTKAGAGGARGVGHEYALPFAESASDVPWAVGNTVLTWARIVVEQRYPKPDRVFGPPCSWQDCYCMPPYEPCSGCAHHTCEQSRRWLRWQRLANVPVTPEQLYAWLAGQLDWLRHRPFAGEAFGELLSIEAAIRRWTDSRGWVVVAPCSAIVPWLHLAGTDGATLQVDVIERRCDAPLRLYDGAKVIRCQQCGAEYDAAESDHVLLLALRGHLAGAAEISRVLRNAGVRVTAERIRKWASRRQLERTLGPADHDRCPPLYRIGDVLDLAEAKPARKADTPAQTGVGA